MSNSQADDDITVGTLQMHLSELETLWQTTKKRDSTFNGVSSDGEKLDEYGNERDGVGDDDGGGGVEELPEKPVAVTDVPTLQPTKPITPPSRSPRPFHSRTPSMEAAVVSASSPASRGSISPTNALFRPHTPPTRSTSTPRARKKQARQASLTTTPERVSVEPVTLPPLQTHAPAILTCLQCSAKEVRFGSRY
ncbi:hypothetical protein ABB37_03694 [Leptomonas pyrrhocoris]|uniref:Uncharacterized protein n=1 Tax=Leptomonas pyrrhocoris TaxID=157538 RepID=A0A0M9G365_LEPPY|nr:hypothetical protein ABB37_03694 [Leptomonas pyrrhocoris]KPA81287.1 hypothetical protein ABB37_03694 [Leptomonas pyrrhocoris]|eukprot:XP_015659726.1 hypothetical protein ABB37_03694 [Leptomonas pyrrhocoris]